ncbi:MAG TPA: sialidase family protein, partial [Armatimonadota bacterium]|nr:sialidase family protein [Armatimonadota bacterium]
WATPEVLFQHQTRAAWATELFTGGERPCIFVHTFDTASHYLELKTFQSFTDDAGKHWSDPISVPGGLNSVCMRQGIVLHNGDWVFPVYWQEVYRAGGWDFQKSDGPQFNDSWRFCCGALRSADQGKSFSLHGNLHAATSLWEPNIVEIAPHQLVMLIRAEGTPCKYRSDSHDGGKTWSHPHPTDIPDANSKITLLTHGNDVIMLHNPSTVPGWNNRTTLALWLSHDGCQTWPTKIDLVSSQAEGRVICYPHAFIDEDAQRLYIAVDAVDKHYFFTMPLSDLA